MTYLSRPRPWRELAATLWLMFLAAGLLATSDVDDGSDGGQIWWSGSGPNVTLSPDDPVRAFAVRLVMPNLLAATERSDVAWSLPFSTSVRLRVGSTFVASNREGGLGGEGGEAGASSAPAGTPWIRAKIEDASEIVAESPPFLTEWSGHKEVTFSGNCQNPDPEGVDPCVAAFTVEFELDPLVSSGTSEISWSVDASKELSFTGNLTATVQIQPL